MGQISLHAEVVVRRVAYVVECIVLVQGTPAKGGNASAGRRDSSSTPAKGPSPGRWHRWGRGNASNNSPSAAANCSPLRDGAAAHAEAAASAGDAARDGRRRLSKTLWLRK
jgi:hypothetical protein